MPILHVVPDPQDDPEALAPVSPDLPAVTATTVPLRWFPCAGSGVGAEVRAHVLTVLNAWAVDTDTMADAMVLVSELVTNVRDHTLSEELGVRVHVAADRIVVAVVEQARSDAGPTSRFEPGAFLGPMAASPSRDRGRGLQILDSVASAWGFVRHDGVTTGWFSLPATPPAVSGRDPEIRRF